MLNLRAQGLEQGSLEALKVVPMEIKDRNSRLSQRTKLIRMSVKYSCRAPHGRADEAALVDVQCSGCMIGGERIMSDHDDGLSLLPIEHL